MTATRRRGIVPTLAAIVLALSATALTRPAAADDPAAQSATSSPPVDTATPLALRPSKPLALAPEAAHTSVGWKIVAVLAILGGAAYYLRKRGQPRRLEDAQLTIVRRAAIGFRSELVVVNVEGQRLLIGVTPHTIQSLAILDGDAASAPAAAEREEVRTLERSERADSDTNRAAAITPGVGERFAAMLKTVDAAAAARPAAEPAAPAEEAHVAGQARGLLALRRRG